MTITDIQADILYENIISAECAYQILVTTICNGDRIFYFNKLFPNISALNSKHNLLVIE